MPFAPVRSPIPIARSCRIISSDRDQCAGVLRRFGRTGSTGFVAAGFTRFHSEYSRLNAGPDSFGGRRSKPRSFIMSGVYQPS